MKATAHMWNTRKAGSGYLKEMYSNLEMGYSSDKLIYANMCLPHFLSSFIYKGNYNIPLRKQSKNQINQSIN